MNNYLRLADPSHGAGGEANHLVVDALMVPIAQQQVQLAVILERFLLPICHIHNQRPVQPCCPLHPVVAVVEVCSRLQAMSQQLISYKCR